MWGGSCAIASRYGDWILPRLKQVWINNRLDVNDVWKLVNEGEKVTFWCTGVDQSCAKPKKRALNEGSQASHISESAKKLKMSKQEERRAMTEEYETKVKDKHGDKFTSFSGPRC